MNSRNTDEKGATDAERHLIVEKNTVALNQPIYFKDLLNSEWKPEHVLCWERGFAFVSTGEEKL